MAVLLRDLGCQKFVDRLATPRCLVPPIAHAYPVGGFDNVDQSGDGSSEGALASRGTIQPAGVFLLPGPPRYTPPLLWTITAIRGTGYHLPYPLRPPLP